MTKGEMCGDNRFELIAKAKKELIAKTNIEARPEEMAVIDSILFRMWQMGWLPYQQSNPWHRVSEELPGKGQLVLISNPAIQFAIYDGLFRPVLRIGRKFEVADEHVFVETKYWMEIPEIMEEQR